MKLAILVARYGAHVVGGAESQARGMAEEAARRGWSVEVWTTCAESHESWANTAEPGATLLNGVTVRRFPVDPWDRATYVRHHTALIRSGYRDTAVQHAWVDSSPRSQALYDYVAAHAAEYDVLMALPYVATLLYPAIDLAADRVVWWPCLHNEIYAYLEPIRARLERVWGVAFNSPEEADLAIGPAAMRLRRSAVLGEGVTIASVAQVAPPAADDRPYLLYIGRLEEGKNLPLLYEYMQRTVNEGGRVRLVTVGKGGYVPPPHPAFDHRGFVDEVEKARLLSGALALCQPSLFESFSLVMMESWLAQRPALVHTGCAVTRGHVTRAKGGLHFATYGEFRGALDWFRANPALAARMGRNGRDYVRLNFTWPTVMDRFAQTVAQWRATTG